MKKRVLLICLVALMTGLSTYTLARGRHDRAYRSWMASCDSAASAQDRGDYEQAIVMYDKALATSRQMDPQGELYAKTLEEFVDTSLELNRYGSAESAAQQAVHIRAQKSGSGSMDVGNNLVRLAQIHLGMDQYSEAEKDLAQVNLILRSHGRENDIVDLPYLSTLGLLHQRQGRYAQAIHVYSRCLSIEKSVYGPDDPEIASSLRALASVFIEQRKYDQAKPLLIQAVTLSERSSKEDPLRYARSLNSLGVLYTKMRDFRGAERAYRRSLAIIEKHSGPNSPHARVVTENYEKSLKDSGKPSATRLAQPH